MSRRTINAAYRAAIKARLVASGHYASEPPAPDHPVNTCPTCGKNTTHRVDPRYRCRCACSCACHPANSPYRNSIPGIMHWPDRICPACGKHEPA